MPVTIDLEPFVRHFRKRCWWQIAHHGGFFFVEARTSRCPTSACHRTVNIGKALFDSLVEFVKAIEDFIAEVAKDLGVGDFYDPALLLLYHAVYQGVSARS